MFPLYVLLSQTPNSKYYFVMSLTFCCSFEEITGRTAPEVLLTLLLLRLPLLFTLLTLALPDAEPDKHLNDSHQNYHIPIYIILYIPYLIFRLTANNHTTTPYLYFIHYRTYLACPVKRVSLGLFRFKIHILLSIQQGMDFLLFHFLLI